MPSPRILHLVTLSDWGGAQQCVFTLACGLGPAFDVTIACAPGGPLVARAREAGIRVAEIPTLTRALHPLADAAAFGRLLRWLWRERFDLVHCHSTKAGLLGRLAARLAGVPGIIFTAHAWPFNEGWPSAVRVGATLAERTWARFTGAIICVAEHVRREALRMHIGRPEQFYVVHNGVDPALWATDRRPPEPETGEACTVLMVGRLKPPKDPATLIEAWRRVGGPHRLLFVGDGPLRSPAEALARRNGLSDRIAFLGARTDVPVTLRQADIFALSSAQEGLPLAVIEAMMSGVPVVASDVGGIAEAVVDGLTGFVVPPRDPAALAGALQRLLADPALRARMGAAAHARALQRFTAERMVTQTAAVYEHVLGVGRTPTGA